MVQANIRVALAPSGTIRRLERQRQVNLSFRKAFKTGRLNYSAEFDLYNALNADTILNMLTTGGAYAGYGTASYDVPGSVMPGRLPRVALRLNW